MPPASVLCSFELAEHFARFIELSCIGSITDFEDGFGRHCRPFRGRLGTGVEEVEQYLTQGSSSARASSSGHPSPPHTHHIGSPSISGSRPKIPEGTKKTSSAFGFLVLEAIPHR
jgi:hypothetical protein